jgi:hypothetical protein
MRILGALALLAVAGFCSFGFMAAREYSETSRRLPWQIGYAALGLLCLGGVALVLRPRRHGGRPGNTRP